MLKIFKIVALLEGLSYILLLGVGMPLKYMADNDVMVKSLGMPHGVLFIAYVIIAFLLKVEMKWDLKNFLIILVCSLLPFGTFYVDRKYLKA